MFQFPEASPLSSCYFTVSVSSESVAGDPVPANHLGGHRSGGRRDSEVSATARGQGLAGRNRKTESNVATFKQSSHDLDPDFGPSFFLAFLIQSCSF